jgi:hypothetical protein
MDLRHPIQSLTSALMRALDHDLDGVESAVATDLLASGPAKSLTARPAEKDCTVVLFSQSWTTQALGFNAATCDCTHVDAETVVVTGPRGDACVYVSTQLLYHVRSPNRRFFLDVAAQHMRAKAEAHQYEGRDSADEEAFDYEVAGALARVRAVASRLDGAEAERIARRLADCADELRRPEARVPAANHASTMG